MATRPRNSSDPMTVVGSGNIQVGGDLHVTQILLPTSTLGERGAARKLSTPERQQLAIWADEVVDAEVGLISAKIVRASLNEYVGVKSVAEMTADMYVRASVYLQGWISCASGASLSHEACVAQVLRMWAIVPSLRGITNDFCRAEFQQELLKNMTIWELRTTMAFVMTKWQQHWELRNA